MRDCRELSRVGGYVVGVTQRSVPVDAYIIGAGPGGLATAAALRSPRPARRRPRAQRQRRHARGVATTTGCTCTRRASCPACPGFPIPKEMGRWVARDDVVRYLELYAAHHRARRAPRHRGEPPRPLRPTVESWTLTLADGTTLTAPYVVVATGFNHTPREPDVPGLQGYSGEVVLARDYRNGSAHARQGRARRGHGQHRHRAGRRPRRARRRPRAPRRPHRAAHPAPQHRAVCRAVHRDRRAAPADGLRRPGRAHRRTAPDPRPDGAGDAAPRHRAADSGRARQRDPRPGRRHHRRDPDGRRRARGCPAGVRR